MLFLRAIRQRNCFRRSYFPLRREASFRLPVVYEFDLFDRHVPGCPKDMGMDSLIRGAPPCARNTAINGDKSSDSHLLLSLRFSILERDLVSCCAEMPWRTVEE